MGTRHTSSHVPDFVQMRTTPKSGSTGVQACCKESTGVQACRKESNGEQDPRKESSRVPDLGLATFTPATM